MIDSVPVLVLLALGLLSYIAYKWLTQDYDYFKKRGIPAEKPQFCLGNTGSLFLNKQTFIDFIIARNSAFPNEK